MMCSSNRTLLSKEHALYRIGRLTSLLPSPCYYNRKHRKPQKARETHTAYKGYHFPSNIILLFIICLKHSTACPCASCLRLWPDDLRRYYYYHRYVYVRTDAYSESKTNNPTKKGRQRGPSLHNDPKSLSSVSSEMHMIILFHHSLLVVIVILYTNGNHKK